MLDVNREDVAMGWMGKLIGGTLGFVIGGPLGAIAGAAFGHTIDKSGELSATESPFDGGSYGGANPYERMGGAFGRRVSSQQRAQMTFFIGAFSMVAKVAAADGSVSQAEMKRIREFMDHDLQLDPQSKGVAERIFHTALSQDQPYEQLAQQFYGEFRSQSQILELLIDFLYRVAAEDGGVTQKEEELIQRAARIFQFSQQRIDNIRRRYAASAEKHYAVLGVSPQDSNDAIKKAYRSLVREYHPDTIASKGLPEEFNKFAADKFREIQEAYEAVRQERGF